MIYPGLGPSLEVIALWFDSPIPYALQQRLTSPSTPPCCRTSSPSPSTTAAPSPLSRTVVPQPSTTSLMSGHLDKPPSRVCCRAPPPQRPGASRGDQTSVWPPQHRQPTRHGVEPTHGDHASVVLAIGPGQPCEAFSLMQAQVVHVFFFFQKSFFI
jgi:hypothetical protein